MVLCGFYRNFIFYLSALTLANAALGSDRASSCIDASGVRMGVVSVAAGGAPLLPDKVQEGIVIPLDEHLGKQVLLNSNIELEQVLSMTWSAEPKHVRIELHGGWLLEAMLQLRERLQEQWPSSQLEWSSASVGFIGGLQRIFPDDRVGYHGDLIDWPLSGASADFFAVDSLANPLLLDGSFDRNKVDLRLSNEHHICSL